MLRHSIALLIALLVLPPPMFAQSVNGIPNQSVTAYTTLTCDGSTDNTASLQAAINANPSVTIGASAATSATKVCMVSSLVTPRGGHSRITLQPGMTVRQLASATQPLLVNWAYQNRGWVSTAPTYVSGASACTNGTQTVTFTNGGATTAAVGSITVAGGVPSGTVALFQPGALYTAAPTTATISTCTGTATFSGAAITGAGTAVTLTWTAGYSVSVAWTGHGLAQGNYVYLAGSSPSAFNGVFPVISVTDANNFIIYVNRLPTASPTGSAVALVADQDITIDGGTWDYNYPTHTVSTPAGSPGSMPTMNALTFGAIQNARVRDVSIQNVQKYALQFSAARDVVVEGENCNTRSDCLHFYGPMTAATATRIYGIAGDDIVAINTKDFNNNYDWAVGDLLNINVSMVDSFTSATVNEVVVSGDAASYVGGIRIRDLSGAVATNCVTLTNQFVAAETLNDVSIENNNCIAGANSLLVSPTYYVGSSTMNIGSLDYKGGTPNQSANNLIDISVAAGTTMDRFNVEGLTALNPNFASSTQYVINLAGSAGFPTLVKETTLRNIDFIGTSSGRFINQGGFVTMPLVVVDSVRVATAASFYSVSSAVTAAPNIFIRNSSFTGGSFVVSCAFNCNVGLSGNTFTTFTAVLLANGTVTTNFSGDGTNIYSSAPFLNVIGTPTVNIKDWDAQVDASTTGVNRATGNFFNNTNAALGTLGQTGPIMDYGTAANSWKLLANPTTATY